MALSARIVSAKLASYRHVTIKPLAFTHDFACGLEETVMTALSLSNGTTTRSRRSSAHPRPKPGEAQHRTAPPFSGMVALGGLVMSTREMICALGYGAKAGRETMSLALGLADVSFQSPGNAVIYLY
jgi:hypothetical protein